MRRLLLGLLVISFAAGSAAAQSLDIPAPNGTAPSQLHMAIMRYFDSGDAQDTSDFSSVLADLNGDGEDDAVVLVRGLSWCGNGGCTMLVFRGTSSGFRFVSRSTVSDVPIRLSSIKSKGWKTLIVNSRKTGDMLLKYDGRAYPSDPSLQRRATEAQATAAKVIMDRP